MKKTNHGGKRPGAGRKLGTGKFGEKTVPIRIPLSKLKAIKDFIEKDSHLESYESSISYPFFDFRVPAGYPSLTSSDHFETIDIPSLLSVDPKQTFLIKVSGDSMINAGINEGDFLVVDKSLQPINKSIVVACLNGESTVKRLIKTNNELYLKAENEEYPNIPIQQEDSLKIFGVVTSIIRLT